MSTVIQTKASDFPRELNLAELAGLFGPIPFNRIRMEPRPGTATEEDAIYINERKLGLCELVDGVLLEKTVGWYESYLGLEIAGLIREFVKKHNLGITLGEQAMLKLFPGRIRLPDCCFVSWTRMGTPDTNSATLDLGPDLAVEVISPGNTFQEMQQKLLDYFKAGTQLVWYVYPTRKQVHVYTNSEDHAVLTADKMLTGSDTLPGFSLDLSKLFAPVSPNS